MDETSETSDTSDTSDDYKEVSWSRRTILSHIVAFVGGGIICLFAEHMIVHS